MRELGSIVQEKDARVVANYLLTLGISTKLVPKAKGDGWVVWVHQEDRLDEARKVFGEYQVNPADPQRILTVWGRGYRYAGASADAGAGA